MGRTSFFLSALVLATFLNGCGSQSVEIGTATSESQSTLFTAIAKGNLDTVKDEIARDETLLDQKEGSLIQTPLHMAARSGQTEIVQFLIESGADVNARDAYGQTPLSVAMDQEADDELIQLLKDSGADD